MERIPVGETEYDAGRGNDTLQSGKTEKTGKAWYQEEKDRRSRLRKARHER